MHVTYTPEDGDRQEWDFNPGRVRSSEARVLEKVFGENWETFTVGVQSGNIGARRVMLWHLLRLQHPMLRYDDVPDFYTDELVVEFSTAELAPMLDRMRKANLPEDKREQVLAALDFAMSEAMAREEGESGGKALSTTSPTDGGSSSPPNSTSPLGASAT